MLRGLRSFHRRSLAPGQRRRRQAGHRSDQRGGARHHPGRPPSRTRRGPRCRQQRFRGLALACSPGSARAHRARSPTSCASASTSSRVSCRSRPASRSRRRQGETGATPPTSSSGTPRKRSGSTARPSRAAAGRAHARHPAAGRRCGGVLGLELPGAAAGAQDRGGARRRLLFIIKPAGEAPGSAWRWSRSAAMSTFRPAP